MTTSTQDPEAYVLVSLGGAAYVMPRDLAFKIFDTWTTTDVYRWESKYNPSGPPKVTARPAIADSAPSIRPLTHAELHAAIAAARAQDDAQDAQAAMPVQDPKVALYQQRAAQAAGVSMSEHMEAMRKQQAKMRGGFLGGD